MNPGGEPERDDTGLPPVDIEIPDDARDLDGDVQAYYRELRAQRRQQRGLRLRGSLSKDGIILPLLACCLILALITGTLLTVFTATSDQNLGGPLSGKPAARPSAPAGAAASHAAASGPSSASASPSSTGSKPDTQQGALPAATIAVDGRPAALRVRDLSRAALVLIPAGCNCRSAVSWLISQVHVAHASTYLVYTASTKSTVTRIYAGLSSASHAQATLALETQGDLRARIPRALRGDGLTAILIGRPGKTATYAAGLSPLDDPSTLVEALTH